MNIFAAQVTPGRTSAEGDLPDGFVAPIQSGDIRSLGLPVSPQQAASPEGGPEGAMGAAGKVQGNKNKCHRHRRILAFEAESL